MVTFGLHDLLKDPPFSRLDLISCRNLLTYFDCEARRHSLEIFRYALRETGLLFLGSAEPLKKPTHRLSYRVKSLVCTHHEARDKGVFSEGAGEAPLTVSEIRWDTPDPAIPCLSSSESHLEPTQQRISLEGEPVVFTQPSQAGTISCQTVLQLDG